MVFRHGPVFANLVLADEINRAAPKTQSALLEAMAERHVTVGGQTYPLNEPFLVVATQNPIEQEGTYPAARGAARPVHDGDPHRLSVAGAGRGNRRQDDAWPACACRRATFDREAFLQAARPGVGRAGAAERDAYAVEAVRDEPSGGCRGPRPYVKEYVEWGAGPRGSQNLVLAAKARALLQGRAAPTVEDVRAVALPVLRHRIIVNHRAVGDSVTTRQVVSHLLEKTTA